MNYKTLFQVFLLSLTIIISSIFYLKYFYDNDSKEILKGQNNINENREGLTEGNIIKEILYESQDSNGNIYTIKSDSGKISKTNENEILMTNVTALIKFKDSTFINLQSKKAKYNSLNSNTNFFDDVGLKYLNHKINSENIDILFTDNKLTAYNNLVYRNTDINLKADKVELDLITKNSKIFMFDNSTVKIIRD